MHRLSMQGQGSCTVYDIRRSICQSVLRTTIYPDCEKIHFYIIFDIIFDWLLWLPGTGTFAGVVSSE